MGSPVRVLIADDQEIFARTLEALLAGDEEIAVVGRAKDGEEAVSLAASLAPDVVLMDINMPLVDGIEATRRLRETGSPARVVMLTESDLRGDVVRAEKAGADAYVPKTRISGRLATVVRETARR